nr:hypothetical protein [Acidipropionibacterium virtanenii]
MVAVLLLGALGYGGWKVWKSVDPFSTPVDEGCQVTISGQSYTLDLEQSGNAALITAESIRRGLSPRAASIALATAMQESGLRNIDYGDRDSVGLFQQRPSQGWGTRAQILDPWYSAGKFYDELVKVDNWQTEDINDVAQSIQKSGVPDGYRKHIDAAKAWASALSGSSPQSLSCVNRSTTRGSSTALAQTATKGLAGKATISTSTSAVRVQATSNRTVWAAVAITMASNDSAPISAAGVGTASWNLDTKKYASWSGVTGPSSSPSGTGTATTGSVTLIQ